MFRGLTFWDTVYVQYLDLLQRVAVDTKHAPTALKTNCYVILFALDCTMYCLEGMGGSVAERLACWTQAQKGPGSNRSRDAVG